MYVCTSVTDRMHMHKPCSVTSNGMEISLVTGGQLKAIIPSSQNSVGDGKAE